MTNRAIAELVVVPENKHQQRTRVSTEAMLSAAAELISESGVEALTLVAVSIRSGYSRGLASNRFGSKERLLEQLVDMMIRSMFARGDAVLEERRTAFEALHVMVDSVWRQIEEDDSLLKALYTMMFEAARPIPVVRPAIQKLHHDMADRFEELLNAGIDDGSVKPDIDPAAQAMLIVAELRGAAFLWMLDPERFDPVNSFQLVSAAFADRVRVVQN